MDVDNYSDLPLFPLSTVLFPGMVLPLHIFEDRYKLMINRCLEEERPFGVLLIRRGVEVAFSKELFDILFSGSYTWRDTEIDGGQFDGSELPFVPEHQASLGARAPLFENVSLGVNGTYVGKRHFISDFTNTDGLMDDYINLSAKLTYALEMGSVYLAVNNILNEEYSEYGTSPTVSKAYYPAPKANMILGANYRF